MRRGASPALGLLAAALLIAPLRAQQRSASSALLTERRDFAAFLRTGATSPYAALAHQSIGDGLSLGPATADIPVEGLAEHRVRKAGRIVQLRLPDGTSRPLLRGRPVPLARGSLVVRGTAERPVVTLYGTPSSPVPPPAWYPPDPRARLTVQLNPADAGQSLTLLDSDGVDAAAVEVGTVALPTGETLRVRRIALDRADESELEIFFRDETNGRSTYPAGRFVTLQPQRDGSFVLDFNRARNPSCAYNTVFPCPAPWPGNTLRRAMTAGEKYEGK